MARMPLERANGRSGQGYLQENLLGDDEDDPTPPDLTPFLRQRRAPDASSRLVIAIDYGTTFTGVASATPRSENARLEDIEVLTNWGPRMGNHNKIPSVFSYSPASSAGEEQWGASISPDAVTMINTKLELDVHDDKIDELELILQVLDGTSNLGFDALKKCRGCPDYTWKDPEEIVTDYLTKVFKSLDQSFEYFGSHLKAQLQVDIVITVPVIWSYRAKNSTLRAVRKAGFNEDTFPNLSDMIIVTEAEAAAIYTARYLKEDKNTDFLKLGECFVLCDAGGGTVDTVSYKVTQLVPTLELKQITIATSAKCGSSFIDTNFKRWLQNVLGDKHYRKTDPKSTGQQISAHATEGKEMRELIKAFDACKKGFSKNTHEVNFYLPKGSLHKLKIPGRLLEGELTITNEEMRGFFDPCVDKVIGLILGQIQQVERTKNRVKNVFLVGGFGESSFLQDELNHSLVLRKIKMRRPDSAKAWTAVVQGAVIYGIEKDLHENIRFMSTCSRSYCVALNEAYSVHKFDRRDRYVDPLTNNDMAQHQLTWLVRRGDLILSDDKRETEKEFAFNFQEKDVRKLRLPIFEYVHDDDDLPDRYETGQNELTEAAVLDCDLSSTPLSDFYRLENPNTGEIFYSTYLISIMTLCIHITYGFRRFISAGLCPKLAKRDTAQLPREPKEIWMDQKVGAKTLPPAGSEFRGFRYYAVVAKL